jgi:hypothetical protein
VENQWLTRQRCACQSVACRGVWFTANTRTLQRVKKRRRRSGKRKVEKEEEEEEGRKRKMWFTALAVAQIKKKDHFRQSLLVHCWDFFILFFFFIFSGGKKTLHTHLRVVRQNNWTGYITTEEERNYIGRRERAAAYITLHTLMIALARICLSLPNKAARLWHHAHNPTFGCVLSAGGGWRIYTPKQNDRTRTARGKVGLYRLFNFPFFSISL